jgi:transposase
MFVRVKTSPNSPKKAVQIVESVRKEGKVRQRIVRQIGTALDDMELKALKDLAEHIKAKIETENQPSLFRPEQLAQLAIEARNKKEEEKCLMVDLKKLRHQQSIITGIHEIYGKVYKELGFERLFSTRHLAAAKNLFHIVMARIANPSSKKHSVEDLSENFGTELSLASVYRMMDCINEAKIKKINHIAYQTAKNLFNQSLNVVFYDCTTLYFESFTGDELKENGFSKDMKFNQPQVLLALLTTHDGLPIGYEVFPGSTFEGHTLVSAIEKIRQQYKINRVIFTADAAMLSNDNLNYLESEGIPFIVGARLKNMSEKIKGQILDLPSYTSVKDNELYQKIREIYCPNGRKLIVTHSLKRAEKDLYDRQETVKKLQQKLQKSKAPASLISNYGYKRFLRIKGEATVEMDTGKMENAAQWDGLHGVVTHIKDLPNHEIISHYHSLWEIEQCFRVSKHDLKVRPIFHWTPHRVKAHLAICFIALVCVRYLGYRVRLQYKPMSAERIRNQLNTVRIEILKHGQTKQLFGVPTRITQEIRKIYSIMNLKISDVPFIINS